MNSAARIYGDGENEFGRILVGVWMTGPRQAMLMKRVMEKAMADFAGRPEEALLAKWHNEAVTALRKAKDMGWAGWGDDYPVEQRKRAE